MPSSISTVRLVGVPSSSMESEPRREAMVPSSTTVTPLAATCLPMRPAKAEVCLRLKSPSSPCPTASCSITPGQPAPSTTVISPAGAGIDSHRGRRRRRAPAGRRNRLEPKPRLAQRLVGDGAPPARFEQAVQVETAAAAMAGGLAPPIALDHHADIEPHERAQVGAVLAVAAEDLDRLVRGGERRGDADHGRLLRPAIGVDPLQYLELARARRALD